MHKKLLLAITLSIAITGIIFAHHMNHSQVLGEEASVQEQLELQYDKEAGSYKPVSKSVSVDSEMTHYTGKIDAIEIIDDHTLNLIVTDGEETLSIRINEETYIGNYTKSPQKSMGYLEVGMDSDISYYSENDLNIASAINVMN